MPRPATGELRPLANGWEARVRIEGKTRKGFALLGSLSAEDAASRCRAMASLAQRLRAAGHAAEAPQLLEMAARARPGRPWEAILAAVDALCAGTTEAIAVNSMPTFVDFARDWTSGKLHKRWPDHVYKKKDASDDERIVKLSIEPVIGDLRLDEFTLDHAEQIMANVPEARSASTRRHVAQLVRRVLALAVYPARHLRESPIPRGWLPKVKRTKAFSHLYPEEDRALLSCRDVDLARRLFFGILAREGLRREELASLSFKDLDLVRGHIALDRNKTDDPRSWALSPGVASALQAWRDRYRPKASAEDSVFGQNGVRLYVEQMAAELRADLKTAGVTRESLFERSDARRPMRVHDLRATFVTVSLANGKTETWVADRTGHRSSEMINRYRRAARTWSELNLGPLGALDECIPELARLTHALPHDVGDASEGQSGIPCEVLAESKGFEPLVAFTTPDFESGTFGHSVSSPPRKFVDRRPRVKRWARSGSPVW
jgi:integrase